VDRVEGRNTLESRAHILNANRIEDQNTLEIP